MVLNLFKRKKESQKDNQSRYLSLTIKKIKKETSQATTIVFERPFPEFNYKPGQYLTLIVPFEGTMVRRTYSLCSSPYRDEDLAITIKKISGGSVSNWIPAILKVGDVVDVMEPMGLFTTEIDPERKRKIILFAGGSGITPLMSIAKSILFSEPESEVLLIYQSRNQESIIFREELNKMVIDNPARFRIKNILSRPATGWVGLEGRLSESVIKDILSDEDISGDVEFFLCGPAGMMDTVEKTLGAMGIEKGRIKKESFTSGSTAMMEVAENVKDDLIVREVTVLYDGEEYRYKVEPDSTILESGLDQNIDLPFSCQSGMCTTCRGKLISGKVRMEDSDGLSDEELANGYILPCVSHPLTDDVKVEIG